MSLLLRKVYNGPMVILSHKGSFNSLFTMSRALQSQNSRYNLTSNLSCLKSEILKSLLAQPEVSSRSVSKFVSSSPCMFSVHVLPRVKCSVEKGKRNA